ncbi:MAG: DUF5711 family protein [Roseburia sp.]|nr:DUF5711 family protein [Roseburia sp.]
MAEIRNFNRNQYLLKGSKSTESAYDDEDERDSQSRDRKSLNSMLARHRQIKLYTVLGILAIIAVVALCLYFNWKNMVYSDYEVVQQNDWTRAGETKCLNLSGSLFTYSKDGMSCTDTKGKVVWNQTYEMQNPMVRTCGRTVAVGDYNGRSIYVADTQGILGTIDTAMPIRDFCVSEKGIVATVLDDSNVTAIYLYSTTDTSPLVYFKTTMSKSGYPIAIDISGDGTQMAVSYLKAESGKVYSGVGFYNFSAVGQNYTDNLVGGYGYFDAVVPLIHFMGNDTIFAVADNSLMFYQGRQIPENTMNITISEEIQSVWYSDTHVGLVFHNQSDENAYRLDVYDTNARKVSEIYFDVDYTDILFDTAGIMIRSDNELLIYDWDGRLKYEGGFKERVVCLLPSGSISKYTIVTDNTIQQITLY